mgnify:CR=1 FL=1
MSTANNKNKNNLNNKKTSSSGTGRNTALLGLPTNSSISNKENSNNQNLINDKNNIKQNQNQDIKITKSLQELEKETEEMQIKLAQINSEMDKERNLLMQEASDLNNDITERGFEISCLSSENKNLINNLKDIKSSLDDKMKISKTFLVKMQLLEKSEKNMKKKIEVLEKEIILAQKNSKIVQKDCKRLKILAKNNEEGKEKILNDELINLQKTQTELENNNLTLRKIIKDHKQCPRIKSNLVSKLNMLTNSLQFEQKKTNKIGRASCRERVYVNKLLTIRAKKNEHVRNEYRRFRTKERKNKTRSKRKRRI